MVFAEAMAYGLPLIATTAAGRDLVVIPQKSGVIWALDPDKGGEVVWQYRYGQGSGLGASAGGVSMRTSFAGGSVPEGLGIFLGGVGIPSPAFGITVVPPQVPLEQSPSQQPFS